MIHQPVLLHEVVQLLNPRPGEDFIDATFGGGGHALEILKQTAPDGKLLGIDWDSEGLGLETGSENLIASEPLDRSGIEPAPFDKLRVNPLEDRLFLKHGNFADIDDISKRYFPNGVDSTSLDSELDSRSSPQVDGVLFDFGFSSFHIDESERGFSYSKDEPLDMRYSIYEQRIDPNITNKITAGKIINEWPERELERIFREFGEERNARKIAQAIARARQQKRIETTGELVEIIDGANKSYMSHKTYARVFQALRIAVNDELANIERGLAGAWRILKPGGRLAAISFHSLEDRIVKNFFNNKKHQALGQILTKKPVTASAEEIANNNRARSAKLRAIKKIATNH